MMKLVDLPYGTELDTISIFCYSVRRPRLGGGGGRSCCH